MSLQRSLARRFGASNSMTALLAVACLLMIPSLVCLAGGDINRFGAVGGVMVDGKGVVTNATVVKLKEFQTARQKAMQPIAADLDKFEERRAVSLRGLEEAIVKHRASKFAALPDEIRYLAGLQRVEYVMVLPEKKDIVLMGPAEGWKTDRWGMVVGKTTGRPVLLLDDLIVALRTAESSNETGISCSIDPTPEGLRRMRPAGRNVSPEQAARQMEEALGPQVVTVTGVPATSVFGRVLVAADYRMKRLAMNFEDSPVANMPSFLHLMRAGSSGMNSSMPRWWLAPDYDPLLTDPDRLSWQIRGQGVQCMTEMDFREANGSIKRGAARGSLAAKKWADTFTEKFSELANKDSVFGQLRNLMDLAVVTALIEKEDLFTRADLALPHLMEEETVDLLNAPRHIATQASVIQKGRKWVISASGGVQIYPWLVADKVEVTDKLSPARTEIIKREKSGWWN